MTENTKYLDELLLSYKQTIHELKQSNKVLKDIIDKLLNNHDSNHKHKCVNRANDEDVVTTNNEVIENGRFYDGDNQGDIDGDSDSDSDKEDNNCDFNHENSQILHDIFKIVDEYNESKLVKSFPSYEYFKSRGITRYMISKENGLKTLRKKYFEGRTFT
jgi:hypothetical protein